MCIWGIDIGPPECPNSSVYACHDMFNNRYFASRYSCVSPSKITLVDKSMHEEN